MPIPQQLPVFLPKDADYSKQSYEVPGTKRPGQTGHYRTTAFPFLTLDSPGTFQNLVEVFDSGRQRVPGDTPLLGHRPQLSKEPLKLADHYVWQSWETVDTRRQRLGSGLDKLFRDGVIGGGQHKTVGIWSGNCPAWQLVDLTLQAYEFVTVSLYDTLGKDTSEFIINHTEMTIIFVAPQHMTSILTLAPKTPTIKVVVSLEPLLPEERKIYEKWGQQLGIKIMDIPELEALGQTNLKKPIYPSPDAIATICYTSGTTGNPKGVVLTHGMIANAVHAQNYATNTNDRPIIYCFLPLAHIYGRMIELGMISRGGSLGYWSGDPTRLLEDMQILKPNLFSAVPRVLNRIFQAGMAAGDLPGLKGALFKRALAAKQERFRATGDYTHPIWDRLVFKKLRAVVGGNLQFISSGSAPMSAAGIDFLKIAFSTEVIEGTFGCTENVGTATKAWWGDATSAGTIGAPQVNTEIKLIDVPTMGYTSEDKPFPRGEICLRGDHCFREYYKDPENTKAAVDEEGWQHTGDVGTIDACGRFKIIDRVKNIMKLAQGEYVALERVESLYSACPLLAQLYVHGDSLQSYLIAVAIPDPVQLAGLASKVWKKPVSEKDTAALDRAVKDPRIIEAFQAALNKQAKTAGLQGFETIRRIHLTNEQLTVENGCLTPTLKLKRKDVQKKFQNELDALYALGEPGGSKPVKL